MWKTIRKASQTLAVAALALTLISGVAQAQGAPRPNVAVLVYSADGKGASARVFEPKASAGRELFKINERMNAILSPDAVYAVMQGTTDDQGTFSATRASGQLSLSLPELLPLGRARCWP